MSLVISLESNSDNLNCSNNNASLLFKRKKLTFGHAEYINVDQNLETSKLIQFNLR